MIQIIRKALNGVGLDVRRLSSITFGEDWRRDIQFFSNGRDLETIFDVGANLGQTVIAMKETFPDARIYCFEPVPSTFEQLKSIASGMKRVTAICAALAETPGSIRMTSTPLSVSNRIIADNPGAPGIEGTVAVQVDTVDAFCAAQGIKRINLLKVDTEGYEMNVLKGSRGMLERGAVDYILAECEFTKRENEPHGAFLEIVEFAKAFGFQVVTLYTGGVDNLGWVWGDVLLRRLDGNSRGRVAVSPTRRPR